MPFERSLFHNAKQNSPRSIDQYVTRLRKLAQYCEYADSVEDHIRDQITATCTSLRSRKKFLTEPDLNMSKLIEIGQLDGSAFHQTKQIENKGKDTTACINQLSQYNQCRSHRSNHRGIHHQNYNRANNLKHGQYPPTPFQTMCGRCGARGHKSEECCCSGDKTCETCRKIKSNRWSYHRHHNPHNFDQSHRQHRQHVNQLDQTPTHS